MTIQPLVSVLVPLYNKVDFIAETIESVLNQTYPNIELIIVDDGSTDGSFEIAKRYASSTVFVFSQANKGASAARNTAFDYSKGDFIQYLDADDVLDARKVEEQINGMRRETNVLSLAKMFYFSVSYNGIWRIEEITFFNKDYEDMVAFLLEQATITTFIHSWLIPRELIKKTGKWNETMTIFDDCDFYLRLIPLATKIIHCPKSICYYRMPNTDSHLSQRCDLPSLEASLGYFSRFETTMLSKDIKYHEETRLKLACLYKRLLIIGLKNDYTIEELRMRSLKLGLTPDCGNSLLVRSLTSVLGVNIVFKLVLFKLKYNNQTMYN